MRRTSCRASRSRATRRPKRRRARSPRSQPISKRRRTSRTKPWPRSTCSISRCWRCAGSSPRSTRRSKRPEKKDKDSQDRIKDLGARLNAALARLGAGAAALSLGLLRPPRELLKDRKDIRVVGDRFVFRSEVLFPSGSATLTPEGLAAMDQLRRGDRRSRKEHSARNQVGAAGGRPYRHPAHRQLPVPSNWELSTARAASVVKYLIMRGVSPEHLVAARVTASSSRSSRRVDEDSLRKNRRIELKLTEQVVACRTASGGLLQNDAVPALAAVGLVAGRAVESDDLAAWAGIVSRDLAGAAEA